jgi:hypothetical protein
VRDTETKEKVFKNQTTRKTASITTGHYSSHPAAIEAVTKKGKKDLKTGENETELFRSGSIGENPQPSHRERIK